MSGSAQVFVAPAVEAQNLLAGGAGGGDDPKYPRNVKSSHELDAAVAVVPAAAPARRRKQRNPVYEGLFPCPVCDRRFSSQKAIHGHMRCHADRGWRGMEPPRPPPPGELGADGRRYRYRCRRCGALFNSRQALGGHRASHNGKKGCSWHSRHEAAAAEAEAPVQRPVLSFDLNEPAPVDEEPATRVTS